MEFWNNFYNECLKHKISPQKLGKLINISPATFTKWKNGTPPNSDRLLQIADYFGVSTDYLLGRSVSDPELPDDEKELIQNYRKLSDEGKRIIRNQVKAALPEEVPTKTAETA